MSNSQADDIDLLVQELARLQELYSLVSELSEDDFSEGSLPSTSPEMERIARIADRFGYDGNLFRNLFVSSGSGWLSASRKELKLQIETIPRLIAELDQPPTAIYLGNGKVQIGDRFVMCTNETMIKVLELLVNNKRVSKGEIEKITGNASREIKKLIELDDGALAPYIQRPGNQRNHGYGCSIVDGRIDTI